MLRIPRGRPPAFDKRPKFSAAKFRSIMSLRDISADDLVRLARAEDCVISPRAISDWRRGTARPTAEIVEVLARVLGVKPARLR